jgi:outer membrane murein-binding lipoprotein Lpp
MDVKTIIKLVLGAAVLAGTILFGSEDDED